MNVRVTEHATLGDAGVSRLMKVFRYRVWRPEGEWRFRVYANGKFVESQCSDFVVALDVLGVALGLWNPLGAKGETE